MDQYLISLWIFVGMATVCNCQAAAAIVQPFKDQYELVGSSATLTTVIQKSSKDDLVAISYSSGGDIWKEGTGYTAGYPTEVSVSSAVNPTTHLGEYNVTVDLPNNLTKLVELSVEYKARLLSNAVVNTTARIYALDPVSCNMTGESTKLLDEQVNVTCFTRFYGRRSPDLKWTNLWFNMDHRHTFVQFETNKVGYMQTIINRRVKVEDNGKAFTCQMQKSGWADVDTCQVKYNVLSCNTSTKCIVTPFRNSAGKMGDSVTLSSTFRKESLSDMVVITYDPPQAPGTVIWEEGKNVIPPTGISVKYSVDPTSLLAVYNVTVQLPAYNPRNDADIVNVTVEYSAYMTSQPGVKTTAKVAAVDDVTCRLLTKPTFILPGQNVRMSCNTVYYGYKMPSLNWYNHSGSSIRTSGSFYQHGGGPMEVDISHAAGIQDDGKNFQCKLNYSKNEFDFFPPKYQDTCNVKFSVLYGTKCYSVGLANKQPGQPILMTCTTKYDGVNLPELDWYAPGDNNVTTGRTVNNETNEYKVTFSGTAGNTDKTYLCKLRHEYIDRPWNTTKVLNRKCFGSYTVKRGTTPGVSLATALFPSVWKVIAMVTFVVLQPW